MINIIQDVKDYREIQGKYKELFSLVEEYGKIKIDWQNQCELLKSLQQQQKEDLSSLSFIDKKFKTKKYQRKQKYIEKTANELELVQGKIEEYEKKYENIDKLSKKIDELTLEKNRLENLLNQKNTLSNFSYGENGIVYLSMNEQAKGEMEALKDSKDAFKLDEKVGVQDLVLIHATSFPPYDGIIKNNYDGGKKTHLDVQFDDRDLIMQSYSSQQRITTHFTLNTKVNDHAYGSWGDADIMVIEPLEKQMKDMASIAFEDSWARKSVKLSEEAIIMIPRNKIPYLDLNRFSNQIFAYDGDPKENLNFLLHTLGYKPQELGVSNLPDLSHLLMSNQIPLTHYYTLDSYLEGQLGRRNAIIELIRDNKEENQMDLFLSQYELLEFYRILHSNISLNQFKDPEKFFNEKNRVSSFVYDSIQKSKNPEFYKFLIFNGIVMENNRIRMLDPYQMYDYISKGNINLEGLDKLSDLMEYMLQNEPPESERLFVSEYTTVSEISKYQNIESLQEVNNKFKSCIPPIDSVTMRLLWSTKGLQLQLYVSGDKAKMTSIKEQLENCIEEGDEYVEQEDTSISIYKNIVDGSMNLGRAYFILKAKVEKIVQNLNPLTDEKERMM